MKVPYPTPHPRARAAVYPGSEEPRRRSDTKLACHKVLPLSKHAPLQCLGLQGLLHFTFFTVYRVRLYLSLSLLARNNVGTAFYQLGEHTLAKAEHEAVLALLEARREDPRRLDDDAEDWDVYLDTLVDLHRQARRPSSVSAHLWGRGQEVERPPSTYLLLQN